MKPAAPDLVEEIRRLNVVLHEDEHSITAVSPCPTYDHRPEKVAPSYLVRFACAHGESTNVFCAPCTAVRRAGRWACYGTDPDCYAVVVEVKTLIPTTREKDRQDGGS